MDAKITVKENVKLSKISKGLECERIEVVGLERRGSGETEFKAGPPLYFKLVKTPCGFDPG